MNVFIQILPKLDVRNFQEDNTEFSVTNDIIAIKACCYVYNFWRCIEKWYRMLINEWKADENMHNNL